jgi:transposase-like protein
MIIEHQICPPCQSQNRAQNGTTASGKQMIYGLDCKAYKLPDSSPDTEEKTEPILKTYSETASLTSWQRSYTVALQTVINWIKKTIGGSFSGSSLNRSWAGRYFRVG